ncbi:MAG: hypothetical protein ACJ74Q_15495 [Pyrinomonadaceae bacterium]
MMTEVLTGAPPEQVAFYIRFEPEDFPDARAAAEHFARHWTERLEEDLGITLSDEERFSAVPEEVLLGGGAVFIFDQWRLVARVEFFDFASMSPGDVSPVGSQKLVRCPKCGRTAFVEGYPLDLKAAHFLHSLVRENGFGKSWKGCKVVCDSQGSPLRSAIFTYRRQGRRARSADCMYDSSNRLVFGILLPEVECRNLTASPPAEVFITFADGTRLRPSDGISFTYE